MVCIIQAVITVWTRMFLFLGYERQEVGYQNGTEEISHVIFYSSAIKLTGLSQNL